MLAGWDVASAALDTDRSTKPGEEPASWAGATEAVEALEHWLWPRRRNGLLWSVAACGAATLGDCTAMHAEVYALKQALAAATQLLTNGAILFNQANCVT